MLGNTSPRNSSRFKLLALKIRSVFHVKSQLRFPILKFCKLQKEDGALLHILAICQMQKFRVRAKFYFLFSFGFPVNNLIKTGICNSNSSITGVGHLYTLWISGLRPVR